MEIHNELKEIDIKNRTCYYFHEIINFNDLDLENTSLDKNHSKIF